MLDEYLKREDVLNFVKELRRCPKYLNKNVHVDSKYGMNIKDELALYQFYDVLFKYKMIIDDTSLFPDFLMQIDKIFRKIPNYDDVNVGVYKALIKMVESILDVNSESDEGRKEIIKYFYNRYIVNGYYFHGYSTTYEEFIKGRNFIPERYPNHYAKMMKAKHILEKENIMIDKSFAEESVSFTDDMVMTCYYSSVSPNYFYQMLVHSDKDRDAFLKQDYRVLISSLKRFMGSKSISGSKQKTILKIIDDEWYFMTRIPKKISLLFVKRNKIHSNLDNKLNDYLDSDKDLIEIIERIFISQYNDISVSNIIKYGEYQLVDLDNYYQDEDSTKKEKVNEKSTIIPYQLANSYGVVSILLILGSLFITLGVIVTIIMILKGM